MAVAIKAGARSDYMISDAAMSQRMAEFNKEQMAQFASILGELGKGDSQGAASTMDKLQSAMQTLKDDERFEQALKALDAELKGGRISDFKNDGVYRNKSTGDILPTETSALAKMVVDGELDLKDIPDELITEELMKQIIALMIQARFHDDDEDDKDEKPLDDEELFNPATAAVNEQAASREAGNQMLLELYRILEKRAEEEAKATMLDGISEVTDGETLASIATAELHAEEKSEDGMFEQIIDGMAEAAAEQAEAVQTANGAQNGSAESDARNSEGFAEANPELERIIEAYTAKEADAPADVSKEATSSHEAASRVQNAGEELEMLKNAKLGKTEGETTPAHSAIAPDQSLVFTGANGERIEVKPTEIVEQAQRLVERAIEETQVREQSEYSLVLNPGALGRITVRMVKAADGAISVTIAAENARTQRVLEQHSELMQSNLRSNGIDLESWQTVNESKQDMHAQDYNGSSKNPYFRDNGNNAENSDSDDDGDRTFAEIIASM